MWLYACLTSSLGDRFTMDTGIHGRYFCSTSEGRLGNNWYCNCVGLEVLLLSRVFCLDECDISDVATDNAEWCAGQDRENTVRASIRGKTACMIIENFRLVL